LGVPKRKGKKRTGGEREKTNTKRKFGAREGKTRTNPGGEAKRKCQPKKKKKNTPISTERGRGRPFRPTAKIL